MLSEEIKKGNVEAMKQHDTVARAVYGVVMNKILLQSIELKKDGKTQQDSDVVAILQKTIKELSEEKENYLKVNNIQEAENVERQKQIIAKYLPQMLSEEEIKTIINNLPDKSMPTIMKHFKAEYAGKVDMGIVNKIAKSLN